MNTAAVREVIESSLSLAVTSISMTGLTLGRTDRFRHGSRIVAHTREEA